MPKWYDYIKPLGFGNPLTPGKNKNVVGGGWSNLLMGTPEKRENVSTLRPEQEGNYQQLQNAAQGKGAGGAFGDSADYYRNLLSDDSADFNAFAAPQLRQYNEDIIPGISEQFAGMGSGGLSSSGFRNAQVQGATDLSERLGQIRANLRQAGAQGLQGIGENALKSYSQNMVTEPGTEGLFSQAAPLVGAFLGGPGGAAAGSAASSWLSNAFGANKVGSKTPAYGVGVKSSGAGYPKASAQIGASSGFY